MILTESKLRKKIKNNLSKEYFENAILNQSLQDFDKFLLSYQTQEMKI